MHMNILLTCPRQGFGRKAWDIVCGVTGRGEERLGLGGGEDPRKASGEVQRWFQSWMRRKQMGWAWAAPRHQRAPPLGSSRGQKPAPHPRHCPTVTHPRVGTYRRICCAMLIPEWKAQGLPLLPGSRPSISRQLWGLRRGCINGKASGSRYPGE